MPSSVSPDREGAADDRGATLARVFVSYSRKDLAFVDRLDAELREHGVEALVDRSEIFAFEDWWERIQGLIAQADTVIFVLSPDSVASEICGREIDHAQALNKRLAPVVARPVDPAVVPEALARLNFVFLDDEARYPAGVARLIEGLFTDIVWIRRHSEYGALAGRWREDGHPGSLLLRSPQLEEAERWIASRPANAPLPTEATQLFLPRSRRAASRRRNLLTGALAIGLCLSLALAGLAYWQRREALTQRDAAERNFRIAQTTIEKVTFDLAQGLRLVDGIRLSVLRRVLSRAEEAVQRLVREAPDSTDLQRIRSVMLMEFGTTYLKAGEGSAALAAYEESLSITRSLLRRDPTNALWEDDLSVVLADLSDAKLVGGDTAGALRAIEESVAIRREKVRRKSDHLESQRDLLNGLVMLGSIRLAAGETTAAGAAYEEGLAIGRELVRREPGNGEYLADLGFVLGHAGTFRQRIGDRDAALRIFEEDLAIAEAVVQRQPDSSNARRSLAVSLERVADLRFLNDDTAGALVLYEKSMAIRRRLSDSDPDNTDWRRDLTVVLDRIGVMKSRLGDAAGSAAAFKTSADINRALIERDPNNTQWRHDLAINRDREAEEKLRAGDAAGARAIYEESLAIMRDLVRRDPANSRWRRSLMFVLNALGELKRTAGDRAGARADFEESLAIVRGVLAREPDDPQWLTDLVGVLYKVISAVPERARQRALLVEAIDVLTRLERSGRLDEKMKALPEMTRKGLVQFDKESAAAASGGGDDAAPPKP